MGPSASVETFAPIHTFSRGTRTRLGKRNRFLLARPNCGEEMNVTSRDPGGREEDAALSGSFSQGCGANSPLYFSLQMYLIRRAGHSSWPSPPVR